MIRLHGMDELTRKQVSALTGNPNFEGFYDWLHKASRELVVSVATEYIPDAQLVAEARGAAGAMYSLMRELRMARASDASDPRAAMEKMESEGHVRVAFDDSDRNTPQGSGALEEGTPERAPGSDDKWRT